MHRPLDHACIWLCVYSLLLSGCSPIQPFYFGQHGDLSRYVAQATNIDYPDVEVASLDEVCHTQAPLTLENANFDDVWELTLNEAIERVAAEVDHCPEVDAFVEFIKSSERGITR